VKGLAVMTAKRVPIIPDLPTTGEQGVAGVEATVWNAFFFPKATPKPIVMKMHAAIQTMLARPEITSKMESFGLDTVPHQRARVLDGHAKAQLPFNQQAPRYNAYWRDISARRAPANPFAGGGAQFSGGQMSAAWVGGQPPKLAQTAWLAVAAIGGLEIVRLLLTTAGAMLSG